MPLLPSPTYYCTSLGLYNFVPGLLQKYWFFCPILASIKFTLTMVPEHTYLNCITLFKTLKWIPSTAGEAFDNLTDAFHEAAFLLTTPDVHLYALKFRAAALPHYDPHHLLHVRMIPTLSIS